MHKTIFLKMLHEIATPLLSEKIHLDYMRSAVVECELNMCADATIHDSIVVTCDASRDGQHIVLKASAKQIDIEVMTLLIKMHERHGKDKSVDLRENREPHGEAEPLTIDKHVAEKWLKISGDANPIYSNKDFAQLAGFDAPALPWHFWVGFMLDQFGSDLLSLSLEFNAQTLVDDELTLWWAKKDRESEVAVFMGDNWMLSAQASRCAK